MLCDCMAMGKGPASVSFAHLTYQNHLPPTTVSLQATAVPPVTEKDGGCKPVQVNITGLNMPAWQPCDAPSVTSTTQQEE